MNLILGIIRSINKRGCVYIYIYIYYISMRRYIGSVSRGRIIGRYILG